MRVRVLYFARSREVAGGAEEALDLPPGATTASLLADLSSRHAGLASVLASCVLAVNHEYVEAGEAVALKDGDEIAIIPPLSGG
jgi:molybdopterin synthase catalytic subunit